MPIALDRSLERRMILRPEPPSSPCSGCTRVAGEWKCSSNSLLRTSIEEFSSNSFCITGDWLEGICLLRSCYLSQRVSTAVSAAAAKDHSAELIPKTLDLVRVFGSAEAIEKLLKFSLLLPRPGFGLTSARSLLCRSHDISMHEVGPLRCLSPSVTGVLTNRRQKASSCRAPPREQSNPRL